MSPHTTTSYKIKKHIKKQKQVETSTKTVLYKQTKKHIGLTSQKNNGNRTKFIYTSHPLDDILFQLKYFIIIYCYKKSV